MRAKRRVAALLSMTGAPLWAEIEVMLQGVLDERDRAVRDRGEMVAFIGQVQMLSYEQGVGDLLHDVEQAIEATSADLAPVPILVHLRAMARWWRETRG